MVENDEFNKTPFCLKLKADDFMCTDEDGFFGVPGTCQGLYYACFAGITIEQVSCIFNSLIKI